MTPARGPVYVTVRARTDLGRTRDHNEDAFLVADLTSRTTDLTNGGPHQVGERGIVFLVADGMGGAAAGELASSMAADLIFRHLLAHSTPETGSNPEAFTQLLRSAVEEANQHIHSYSKEHPDVRGMGTTATVAGVHHGTLYLAQVGDSRAYVVREGVATQITKDQSLMQRLVDAGELTEEEAEHSERRNIILQALGPEAKIRVDLSVQEVRDGDTLVICSDGLSGQVKREEIAALLTHNSDLDRLCDALIAAANERGGPDNITVVLARFEGEGLPKPGTSGEVGYHSLTNGEGDTDELPVVKPASASAPPPPSQATPPPRPTSPAPTAAPALPTTPVESTPPPTSRKGSPAVVAAFTGGFLLFLIILYFLLRR